MSFDKNIQIDYAATGDGTTDDSAAFLAWQTDAQAQGTTACNLTIPDGSYKAPTAKAFSQGVKNLTINMESAATTLEDFSNPGAFYQVANTSARLQATTAGLNYVTLITAAQTSFFNVDDWVCVASLEMQSSSGYPPNWVYFEYHQISAIGSGIITFYDTLRYSQQTGWPDTSSGGYDTGGPVTIFNMKQEWAQTIVINANGGTIESSGVLEQCQINAREFTINDATITGAGGGGASPSIGKTIIFNNCSFPDGIEADKAVEILQFNNCTQAAPNELVLQSESITDLTIDGGTWNIINGTTPRFFTIRNATISILRVGSLGYGMNERLTVQNNAISQILENLTANYIDLTHASLSYLGGGLFRTPNAGSSGLWSTFIAYGVPGMRGYFNGTGGGGPTNWGNPFTIQNIYSDATYTYIQTSYSGASLPSYSGTPGLAITKLLLNNQNVLFSNCTGCPDAVDLSQAGAQGKPLWSYSKRTYTDWALQTQLAVNLRGAITAITINVTTPFTGTGALSLNFSNNMPVFSASNVWSYWTTAVDLRTTGLRTITPGSVTGTGGTDDIPVLDAGSWFSETMIPRLSADISGQSSSVWPVVTIEMNADQGVNEDNGAAPHHILLAQICM